MKLFIIGTFVVFNLCHLSHASSCDYLTNMMLRSAKTCEEVQTEIDDNSQNREVIDTFMDSCVIKDITLCKGKTWTFFEAANACTENGLRVCTEEEIDATYEDIGTDCRVSTGLTIFEADYAGIASGVRNVGMLSAKSSTPAYLKTSITVNRLGVHCCADSEITSKRWCKSCQVTNAIRKYGNTGNAIQCDCQDGFTATYDNDLRSNGKPIKCADTRSGMSSCPTNKYAVGTTKICSQLPSSFHSLSSGVCVSVNKTWTGDSCKRQLANSFNDATAICIEAGARVPTLDEAIENKADLKSMIKDCSRGRYVLTSTPCSDNNEIVAYDVFNGRKICIKPGRTSGKFQTVCVAKSSTVQCLDVPHAATSTSGSTTYSCLDGFNRRNPGACKDTPKPTRNPTSYPTGKPTTVHPTVSCSADEYKADFSSVVPKLIKNGPVRNSGGSGRVFAYQPWVNGNCPGKKTFSQAKSLCETNGARLCTLREVKAHDARMKNVGKDAGCGNNVLPVWTSTPCCTAPGTCGTQKNYVFTGSGYGSTPEACETSSGSKTYDVRCCVDSIPDYKVKNFCRNCPANSESSGAGGLSSCSCASGYWGRNGGDCYENV